MKKILAVLSVAALLASFAACGKDAAPETTAAEESAVVSTEAFEEPTVDEATRPDEGRVKEMKDFYVFTPENWCQLTYKQDDKRLELYDTPSAPDIESSTPMVRFQLDAEAGTQEMVDANVKSLLSRDSGKQGKDKQIDGYTFSFLSYKNVPEKRTYFVYMGLVEDHICTITLRGISPNDEDVAAILKSVSFK